jgi:hypothetical protein
MPRYFNGLVSRFSAGQRSSATTTVGQTSLVALELQRLGISPQGAWQLASGQPVTNAEDRQRFEKFLTHVVLHE